MICASNIQIHSIIYLLIHLLFHVVLTHALEGGSSHKFSPSKFAWYLPWFQRYLMRRPSLSYPRGAWAWKKQLKEWNCSFKKREERLTEANANANHEIELKNWWKTMLKYTDKLLKTNEKCWGRLDNSLKPVVKGWNSLGTCVKHVYLNQCQNYEIYFVTPDQQMCALLFIDWSSWTTIPGNS